MLRWLIMIRAMSSRLRALTIYPASPLNIGVSTPAAAIKVGQAFLIQQRRLSTAGQASIVGTVQDDRGVTVPGVGDPRGRLHHVRGCARPGPKTRREDDVFG